MRWEGALHGCFDEASRRSPSPQRRGAHERDIDAREILRGVVAYVTLDVHRLARHEATLQSALLQHAQHRGRNRLSEGGRDASAGLIAAPWRRGH